MFVFSFLSTLTDIKGENVREAQMKKLDDTIIEVLDALSTEHDIYVVDNISYRIMDTILINSGLSHLNIVGQEQILRPLPDPGVIETLTMFDENQKVTIVGSTGRDLDFATRAEKPFIAVKSLTGEKCGTEKILENFEDILDVI